MSVEVPKSPVGLNVEKSNLGSDLFKRRGIIKGRLTKFTNYVQVLENSHDLSIQNQLDLKLRIQGVDSLYTEFNNIQTKIEENSSDSEIPDELNKRDAFENAYYSSLARAKCLLNEAVIADSSNMQNPTQAQSVKLPTISLPTFDGSYENWLEFRDTFLSLVHNSRQISNIQKFHYLKSSLKSSAELVINSIEFSSDNYVLAWELLLERYNNSRLLVNNHVKALFSINQLSKESPILIRNLIDIILKNLRALKILGEPTDTWDTLIIYIIVSKLDKTTEREWETHKCSLYSDENSSQRRIILNDLLSFLKNRSDMLETLQLSHSKENSNLDNKKQNTYHKSLNTNKITTSYCNVSTNKSHDNKHRFEKLSCFQCNAKHPLYSCIHFINSDLNSKLKLVRDYNLCENCLRPGHTLEHCRFGPCRKCNQKHNSLLHNHNNSTSAVALPSMIATEPPPAAPVGSGIDEQAPLPRACPDPAAGVEPIHVNKAHLQTQLIGKTNYSVLLSTALVEVADANGQYHKAHALLDSGSQRCFITESLCQLLNSAIIQSTSEIKGIGDSVMHCSQSCNIDMRSHIDKTFKTRIHCYILPQITSMMPNVCHTDLQDYIPNNLPLADPQFLDNKSIDILIGADKFWDLLIKGNIRLSCGPYLQNTQLGWIVSGPLFNNKLKTNIINCNLVNSLDTQLRKFWEIEELPNVKDTRTDDERICEEHFLTTTTRTKEGRFCVRIMLNQSTDKLGDSYTQAKRRFLSLEKRLQQSPEYKTMYTNFIHEYRDLNHMSRVNSLESPCYFMPHHGVFREHSTTTKLRVVFDASAASSSGKSLNDLQLVGPAIQGNLIAILLRFRQHKFVACADIAKMYRQCLVAPDQRKLQMILWRDDPQQDLEMYELNTVTYGTASAPFLSVRCLKQLAAETTDPQVQQVIREDFYVDDLITGSDSQVELMQVCNEVQKTLQSGCFELRKWLYNFPHEGNPDNSLTQSKNLTLDTNQNISTKTLGLGWNNLSDDFYFNTEFTNNNQLITKRFILSNISQIFDPLGLLSPVIIVVKVLLQQLWLLKMNWDDKVPSDVAQKWNRFVTSLRSLSAIRVPRHAVGTRPSFIELNVFSDASQTAYGACVYVRTINTDSTVSVRLLVSKAKVAPVKPVTIPRLELCAALLGARLFDKVRNSLRLEFDSVRFWTDSTIVLGWLRMAPNKLKAFVQSRITEIHDLTETATWYHVNGKDNPADLPSRGCSLEELSTSTLWWEGPEFLKQVHVEVDYTELNQDHLPEVKTTISSLAAQEDDSLFCFPFSQFSQYNRMKRAAGFMLRFAHNAHNKLNKRTGKLTVDELYNAEQALIRWSQIESFPKEYQLLVNKKSIPAKSNLSRLSLFLDDNKIMRVGGRLNNSREFSYNKMHPILLSSKHYFVKLLFRYEHKRLLHAAPQALLCHLRELWWPVGARNLARNVVHECVMCTRIRGKTLTPRMGDLPIERITPSSPFTRCGVDYAGPFLILNRKGRGAKTIKSYMCIFICFTTRAVHLELVSDLSSEAYLLALKRFVSRRGKPIEIFSDNGRNFVGLMNIFSNFLIKCSSDIIEYATNNQIKFSFIPPYSPHFGGLWEAGVKSCKYHLRRVVGNAHLTFEEFNTVLTQIEAVLNSRPLSPLSSDPQDLSPLTPSHFLIGRPLTAPAYEDVSDRPIHRLTRYQMVENIRQHFWSRWSKEYVSELQVRTKWRNNESTLSPNDLVLVKDDNLPPLKWQLGRVLQSITGKDGVARVADIKTSTGIIRRCYAKICPLPAEDSSLVNKD